MPLNRLTGYLTEVQQAVQSLKNCHIEKYEEEILTVSRANIRIRIRFVKSHLLELNEAVIVEKSKIKHLSYRYHFQGENNKLIFRYDNAPHYRNLETFPDHKHHFNEVIAVKKPAIKKVIEEVKKYLT